MVRERPEQQLLIVTDEGFGKRTGFDAFTSRHRGGLGVRAVRLVEGKGEVVAALGVSESDEVMVVASDGVVIRLPVADVSTQGRLRHRRQGDASGRRPEGQRGHVGSPRRTLSLGAARSRRTPCPGGDDGQVLPLAVLGVAAVAVRGARAGAPGGTRTVDGAGADGGRRGGPRRGARRSRRRLATRGGERRGSRGVRGRRRHGAGRGHAPRRASRCRGACFQRPSRRRRWRRALDRVAEVLGEGRGGFSPPRGPVRIRWNRGHTPARFPAGAGEPPNRSVPSRRRSSLTTSSCVRRSIASEFIAPAGRSRSTSAGATSGTRGAGGRPSAPESPADRWTLAERRRRRRLQIRSVRRIVRRVELWSVLKLSLILYPVPLGGCCSSRR